MGDDGAELSDSDGILFRWDPKTQVYRVKIDDGFRQIVRELMGQLMALLDDPGAPILYRMFPPAYSNPADVERQDEYRRLMMEDLVERRKAECQVMIDTAGQKTLTEEQMLAWSRTINSLRLVLGTYLDVKDTDEYHPPETAEESAFQFLGWLLEETVDAMSRHT